MSHGLHTDVSSDLFLSHGLAKDVGIEIRLHKIIIHVFPHKSASFNPSSGLFINN